MKIKPINPDDALRREQLKRAKEEQKRLTEQEEAKVAKLEKELESHYKL